MFQEGRGYVKEAGGFTIDDDVVICGNSRYGCRVIRSKRRNFEGRRPFIVQFWPKCEGLRTEFC